MKRNKHSLSHYKLATFDMGELIPVGWFEALPGDSIQQATSALIRVSPLVAPVMHPVSVRIHHWFVPFRLVWPDWEKFITGGADGLGEGSVYPTITGNFAAGSLLDYMGVRPGIVNTVISALPVRAYGLIVNEYYRDQDLVTKRVVSTAGGADATTDLTLAKVAWEKDQFTAARPWTQKGPAVTLPLGTRANVRGIGVDTTQTFPNAGATVKDVTGDPTTSPNNWTNLGVGMHIKGTGAGDVLPDIWADLSTATAASVNTIREAFAIQRYQEARAQYGSRYTEYLRYLGVRSSDARLQRPEYLGGGKQTIAFSEVLQTGPGTDAVGTMKGHGIAAMRSRRYRRFFEEHGVVLSLMSVRPRTMYMEGMHRAWSRRTKEDYWQRELELIGQEEVFNSELFVQGTAADTQTFGYNDRYYSYRHLPSNVAGEFRSTLNYWHLARSFAALPVLNASFVTCDPSKRIHAVQTNDVLWVMINHSIQARRMVGKRTIGRVA